LHGSLLGRGTAVTGVCSLVPLHRQSCAARIETTGSPGEKIVERCAVGDGLVAAASGEQIKRLARLQALAVAALQCRSNCTRFHLFAHQPAKSELPCPSFQACSAFGPTSCPSCCSLAPTSSRHSRGTAISSSRLGPWCSPF